VGTQTVNPPGKDYDAITLRLKNELSSRGLAAKRLCPPLKLQKQLNPDSVENPRYNVLGKWKVPGARKTLHFNAHYDVVPVGGQWRHGNPFGGQVEGGWIYGRGTADMKGAIAAFMLALDALRATGTKPRVNVEVSFTADEETDSLLGTGWLVENAPIAPDYALVMEGGEGASICCGHNGVVWLEVEVQGKAAHGSRPDCGINAFEKMSALVLALEEYKKRLSERVFDTPDRRQMRPTINVGGVFEQGEGGKINTVPALARFSIDRRVLPRERVAHVERELRSFLREAASRIPQCRISVRNISNSHPCYSDPDPIFSAGLARSLERVRREPAQFVVSTGFTDMQFFSQHFRIPTLGYGPGGENEHAIDERARLSDLLNSAAIYADLISSLGE
jgi:succinyl-diaminopimelate desuccinylase